jgi:hypothetical protein
MHAITSHIHKLARGGVFMAIAAIFEPLIGSPGSSYRQQKAEESQRDVT